MNGGEEMFLLVTAALANLTFMSPLSSAAMKRCGKYIFLSSCFLRRPQKLTKSSLSIWHYVVSVKSTVKILSSFVAFLENTNIKSNFETKILKNDWKLNKIYIFNNF